MKLIIRSLAILLFITSCSKDLQSTIDNLRCEYQVNPLGIDIMNPRFYWQIKDSRRGAKQIAYQILVSSSLQKLNNGDGDIWNSGRVKSEQSAHVDYAGTDLESYKTYYWKVKIWDKNGNKSAFSKPASWEMGILSEEEWQANWIGNEIVVQSKEEIEQTWQWKEWIWHPTETGSNVPVYFRKKVILPKGKKVTSALMRLTADNKFKANFNGIELGSGNSWQNVYDFDITGLIKKENIIAVEAENTIGDVFGLLFSLKISFDDGTEIYIGADKNTKGWKTSNKNFSNWKNYTFNDTQWKEIKLLGDYESGSWDKIDDKDEYNAPRPVLVRNEIKINKKMKRARAYVTGLGGYVMHINGKRVGDAVFTPGWTDYPKRIQYQTFDVGKLLHKGDNAIGAILGNLWWSSGLGWRGSVSYSKGPLRFFMQLVVDYEDGTSETFVTDENWKVHDAPILKATLYNGEKYDARLEEEGWKEVKFDDSKWMSVAILDKEEGKLVAQQAPLIRIKKEIKPIHISSPSDSVYIVDMGQNFAGWARLKVQGEAGTKIKMRFAETLKPDGNVFTDNLRRAEATDEYILKGGGIEEWQPDFTYHGFRYIEVTGFPGEPGLDAFTGLVVHSDAPVTGEFSCSNELINKIQENITWGQASNMYSVPTDCPQRDERLGWMGDAQAFAATASYNMDMINFFNKWMYDITDGQDDDGAVHDVNPVIVVNGPAAPGWGDAVFVVPWVMYNFYGDKRILEENYEAIVAWVEYMRSKSEGDLYEKSGYGDWVAVEKSPSEPIGSAYYFYGAKMISTMAKILGKVEDEKKYKELAGKIAKAFNEKHFDAKNSTYTGNTQTANLIPLNFGIVPKDKKNDVAAKIAENVIENDNHLTTGFLGVSLLLPTLSNYGYNDLAYKVASQKTYPSWGYTIEKGATSIWELWNGDTESPSMNSRNHFALGSCGEWFYAYLGGIKPSSDMPGFKKIILAPMPVEDLDWAEASLKTTYGTINSHWKRNKKSITYSFTVPVNTTAEFQLPLLKEGIDSVKESDTILYQNDQFIPSHGIELLETTKNIVRISLASGKYSFEVKYK